MRPLCIMTVGYITGVLWGLYLKTSIVPIFFVLGIIAFILWGNLKKYKKTIAIFIIFAIISNMQILNLENKYANLYQDNTELSIIATVVSEKQETTYKYKYTVKVKYVNESDTCKNTNLIIYVDKDVELQYGDTIGFNGTFEFPSSATNYGAFDYKEYLKTKNTYGTVTVDGEIKTIKENDLWIGFIIANNVSAKIKTNLEKILDEHAGLIIGILLGDTSEIADETIENFKTSSMYHILAVSGTHVRIHYNGSNSRVKQNKNFKEKIKNYYDFIFNSDLCL